MASEQFGVPVEQIQFTELESKHSLLGGLFGKKEVRVKASFEPAVVEVPEETEVPISEKSAEPSDTAERDLTQDEQVQAGLDYLENILKELDPDVTYTVYTDETLHIELVGERAGSLIGRRGETLDALQYLLSMIVNRGDREYLRLTVDTCGYREKRKKALQDLATRMSKSVLRTGRNFTLEPMNPYERRIIHSTISEIEGVSSHSIGEEPNRRVVISSDHPVERSDRSSGGRQRSGHGGRDRDRRGGSRQGGAKRTVGEGGMRRIDLSTSFEKDYKRPKPEDALNTGVYGKIDVD